MQRDDNQILKKRLQEPNSLIQVVVGARQVGKSTLVRQVLDDMAWPHIYETADAIPASDQGWIEQIWNRARVESAKTKTTFILTIDEIQKIHQWSETIKRLYDEDRINKRTFRVVLLGSSKLMIQQGLTESLAGRFELIRLSHWKYHEMREAFGFTPEQYAWFGAYPGAAEFISDEGRWKSYVRDSLIETAISKDILMLTRVDKPALLRRLFETGSQYSGQILSYTKIMGQLQDAGNTTTLAHYLHLLDHAELLCGLEKYAGGEARKKASSPKFQTYNAALVNSFDAGTFQQAMSNPVKWGRVVESAVGAHLLAYQHEGFELSYWREGDYEVDFIIKHQNKIIALEVKTGKEKRSGMNKFIAAFSPHRTYQTGQGGIPWQEIIQLHPAELF